MGGEVHGHCPRHFSFRSRQKLRSPCWLLAASAQFDFSPSFFFLSLSMDRKPSVKGSGNLDAYDFLKRQGWRGLGYSLDQADRGLARPVLYSHKKDNSGLGTKKSLVADQWWMRAFDSSLKDLGTGKKVRRVRYPHSGFEANGPLSLLLRKPATKVSRKVDCTVSSYRVQVFRAPLNWKNQ
jgi:hypothetical protein